MAIILTAEDWAEIYYALDTKTMRIQSGLYHKFRNDLEDKRKWIHHLERILAKIGPDGEDAAKAGIEPFVS